MNLYGDSSGNGLIISGGTGLALTGSSLVTLNIGSTVNDSGGANIYYDTQLASAHIGGVVATVQPFMMDSFSWARF
jgi:hypothetical protein